jgi:hypothetical protein
VLLPPGAKGQGSVRRARRWGQLSAALGLYSADLLIAATALEHGLNEVTRNLRRLTPSGVATLDPWAGRRLSHLGWHQSFLPQGVDQQDGSAVVAGRHCGRAGLPRPRSGTARDQEQKGTHNRRPDQHAQGAGQGGAQRLGALIAEAAADAGGVDGDRFAELLFPLG